MPSTALYPRLLGSAWQTLAPGVRDIHGGDPQTRLAGVFDVHAAHTALGRLMCAIVRLPTRSFTTRCDVVVEASPACERWIRSFGSWKLATSQLEHDGHLVERVGVLDLRFRVSAERAGLRFTQVAAYLRLLGVRIRIPRILAPTVRASEAPAADGKGTIVEVALSAPLAGTIMRYHGAVTRSPA